MKKTTFFIKNMDCPSEEQLIRMKLAGIDSISHLEFDIPNRKLAVFHTGDVSLFENRVYDLKLNATLLETSIEMTPTYKKVIHSQQRKALRAVLIINFAFFGLEVVYGWISNSMGLIADSLDMLADASVYGLSLYVVSKATKQKQHTGRISGYLQLILAIFGLIEVIRRFLGSGDVPVFQTMVIISIMALIGNIASLFLLQKHKSKEVHIQASWIFTTNDVIANVGVIVAGVLVYVLSSKIPDLVVGSIIFVIVARGAFRILKLSKT